MLYPRSYLSYEWKSISFDLILFWHLQKYLSSIPNSWTPQVFPLLYYYKKCCNGLLLMVPLCTCVRIDVRKIPENRIVGSKCLYIIVLKSSLKSLFYCHFFEDSGFLCLSLLTQGPLLYSSLSSDFWHQPLSRCLGLSVLASNALVLSGWGGDQMGRFGHTHPGELGDRVKNCRSSFSKSCLFHEEEG